MNKNTAIIVMHCPDKPGIVTNVTKFIHENNGNVINLEQHVDRENERFFMRIEWELQGFTIPKDKIAEYFETLIAQKYQMNWRFYFSDYKPRMALFVSKQMHCAYDILSRYHAGEWNVEIPLIIGNHEEVKTLARQMKIDFHLIKITKENKEEQEAKQKELLTNYNIDFLVLAKYMQVLSDDFVSLYPNKIINIHHSFLPAFPGAKPYHSAYERGVKIIGATGHYVTSELDAGPIIEQDIIRINHTDTIPDLIRKGKDLEKIVLARAIYAHLNRKVSVYNNRAIVFR
jgi:formyltetrahydrofolate deformylase